ncbi:MAG: DUF3618 domain-containing protein, partial [Rhodospirillales bacterium]|nr:DUF3618 domain-containing protein [Rhodospirillales bacterium]
MSPDRKAPEEIQDDIERMRSEMTDTLHAIERKLSPRQMMEQAMDTMRDVNPTRVMDAVRDYPVPLALIGLGLGWIA